MNEKQRMSWANIQKLKTTIQGTEIPVLPINERSLYPLDPYKQLTAEEKKNEASLEAIASTKYIEAQSNVSQGKDDTASVKMVKTIVWGFVIICIVLLGVLAARGC